MSVEHVVINGTLYVPKDTILFNNKPKFKSGQVVYWGIKQEYVRVNQVNDPEPHNQTYYVSNSDRSFGPVSEEVLRALSAGEMGL